LTKHGQPEDRRQIEQAIAALEAQRAILGDAVVETALPPLREKLAALERVEAPTSDLMGERKLVTVMFADISGFTALAETMDPEAVRDLMNACFERLVPVVEKYGGTVDKFIGDEIMALFGAPTAHEDDPERALRAALEMMDALAEFKLEQGIDLGLHIGVNTGLVIAGGLGTRERQEYSVMGDAVNLAARLEDLSQRGEVLIGRDTHQLTELLFEFEEREPIQVKGKAEPVTVYRLLDFRAVPGKVRGIAGLESPLVGRQAELHSLQEAIKRLQVGVGGIVTLVGEAGLGKSRLVVEAMAQVVLGADGRRSLQWVEGRCLSYGTSIAYLPWLDVLRGLLGVTADSTPDAVHDVLCEQLPLLCPGQVEAVYPYLARLMSLPLRDEDETALRDLEGEDLKAGAFRAVQSLLESAAWRRPLVVVCEDMHWADPTSLELLECLLPLIDRAPLLLLCVFRPETEHGSWRIKESAARRFRHRHTDLWLEPLSLAESRTLVGNLLSVEALPPDLLRGGDRPLPDGQRRHRPRRGQRPLAGDPGRGRHCHPRHAARGADGPH
jgi:class 3 adenylate cyclase